MYQLYKRIDSYFDSPTWVPFYAGGGIGGWVHLDSYHLVTFTLGYSPLFLGWGRGPTH